MQGREIQVSRRDFPNRALWKESIASFPLVRIVSFFSHSTTFGKYSYHWLFSRNGTRKGEQKAKWKSIPMEIPREKRSILNSGVKIDFPCHDSSPFKFFGSIS